MGDKTLLSTLQRALDDDKEFAIRQLKPVNESRRGITTHLQGIILYHVYHLAGRHTELNDKIL